MRRLSLLVCLAASCLATADQTLWYGGDLDGRNALRSFSGFGEESYVYDDFDVTGQPTRITGLFGDYIFAGREHPLASARYEIRTGMSLGHGGTLVASGFAAATVKENGDFGFNRHKFLISVVRLSIVLEPGTYWVSLSPVSEATHIITTSGRNGVGTPLGNGNSFWFNPSFGAYYADPSYVLGNELWDFSYRVTGQPVPEPMSPLALMLAGLSSIVFKGRTGKKSPV